MKDKRQEKEERKNERENIKITLLIVKMSFSSLSFAVLVLFLASICIKSIFIKSGVRCPA